MSIATTSIKYGWVYLSILTLGVGTIFVSPSVLRRITLKDRIEVTLAVVERCLATQYQTNPVAYHVAPPSIVRTWTDTNGASVIMTNALEWRDDLSMKVELDAKIKALCPHYVDISSVYDGTTNIIMHTFTGLLTSLNLGDHTNFTAIPAIGTNIATYGPWAWRNYIVAWQERYKVLNAMTHTKPSSYYVSTVGDLWVGHGKATNALWLVPPRTDTAQDAIDRAEADWHLSVAGQEQATWGYGPSSCSQTDWTQSGSPGYEYYTWYVAMWRKSKTITCNGLVTDVVYRVAYYSRMSCPFAFVGVPANHTIWNAQGESFENGYPNRTLTKFGITDWGSFTLADIGGDVSVVPPIADFAEIENDYSMHEGFSDIGYIMPVVEWQFQYCTNKWW